MNGAINLYKGGYTVPKSYFQHSMCGEPLQPKMLGKRGSVVSDIHESILFVLHNDDKKNTLFTFQPNILVKGTDYVKWSLENLLQPLLKKGDNVWAFICGGLNGCESNSAIAVSSYAAYQKMLEFLTSEIKLPFASVCGKSIEDPTVAFDSVITNRNNLYMGGQYLQSHLDTLEKPEVNAKDLEQWYDEVIIPDWMNFNSLVETDINLNLY